MFVYLPKHELNLALYMRPEDITELNDNEDNKENEVELTENDNQETSTHSEYKIPGKTEGRVSYHLSGMYQG